MSDGAAGHALDPRTGADPVVSVIVPAYNAGDHLEALVGELLAQTSPHIEVVVVDDGSTDATPAIGARLADEHPRVRYFRQPDNGGVARARERGVQESHGEFLWFIDADDHRAVDAVDRLVTAARAAEADVVLCSAEFVYAGGRVSPLAAPRLQAPITGKQAFRLLLTGDITGHLWNKLFRRDLALGIRFTPARVHSDLAMVAQLLARARRVTAIPDVLYSYEQRPGSILHSGRRRADSIALVEQAVEQAARELNPRILHTPEYRFFVLRYIVLSGIKDALLAAYSGAERDALLAPHRARLTWRSMLPAVQRRDWRRLLLAVSAKVSLPLHRIVLRLADPGVRTHEAAAADGKRRGNSRRGTPLVRFAQK
jgi:glycosyltransferase involved in cell wall biosynthesis